MKKSSIQLVNYQFKKLAVEWQEGPKDPDNNGVMNMNYNVLGNEKNPGLFRLDFFLTINPAESCGGLKIETQMEGFFIFPKETPNEEMQKLVRINGCSILYSTLRGHISSITSSFPGGVKILPSIVMIDIVKAIEENRASEKVEYS